MDISVLTKAHLMKPVSETFKFIEENRSSFSDGGLQFNDFWMNLQNPTWEEADVHILAQFLNSGMKKSGSRTFQAFYNIKKEYEEKTGKKVYLDVAYFPTDKKDYSLLRRYKLQFPAPSLSKRPASAFDMVFISQSCANEVTNIPLFFVNTGINAFKSERLKTTEPIIWVGGQGSVSSEWLYGDVDIEGKKYTSIVDMTCYGWGEIVIPKIITNWLDFTDKVGNPREHKEEFFKYLHQENPDGVYEGSQYEQVYDSKEDWNNGDISKIVPKVPHVPELVVRANPQDHFETIDDMTNFKHHIFSGNRDSCRLADLMVSVGCSSSNCCAFCFHYDTLVDTDKGYLPIGDIVDNKLDVKVKSRDDDGNLVFSKITNYFDNGELCPPDWNHLLISGNYKIFTTDSHVIFTDKGERSVQQIKDKLTNRSVFVETDKFISKSTEQLLLASLISDASWNLSKGKTSIYLTFSLSNNQSDYRRHKYDLLSSLNPSKMTSVSDKTKFEGSHGFHTFCISSPLLFRYYEMIDRSDYFREMSQEFLDLFDVEALAYWYFNDGSLTIRTKTTLPEPSFVMRRYSDKSIRRFISELNDRFGIELYSTRRDDQNNVKIHLHSSSRERFFELIRPYITPDMLYKTPFTDSGLLTTSIDKVMLYAKVLSVGQGLSKSFKDVRRFDLEVGGTHNYFVRRQGSQHDFSIRVHNCLEGCHIGSTLVLTDKGPLKIKEIVEDRLNIKVASFEEGSGEIVFKPVIDWVKYGKLDAKEWFRVDVVGAQSFPVTPGHQWHTSHGKVTTIEISHLIASGETVYLQSYKSLTKSAEQILLGSLLSDASWKSNQATVRFTFGDKQRDWMERKKSVLSKHFHFGNETLSKSSKLPKAGSHRMRRINFFGAELMFYYNMRSKSDSGKTVSDEVLSRFDAEALATWYYNDGTWSPNADRKAGGMPSICISSYSDEFVSKVLKLLKERFNLNFSRSSRDPVKNALTIYPLSSSTEDFLNIVAPYATEMVKYKLPERYQSLPEYIEDLQPVKAWTQVKSCRQHPAQVTRGSTSVERYDITVQDTHNYYVSRMRGHKAHWVRSSNTINGSWRERSVECIKGQLREARLTSASNSVNMYSYNFSYHSGYPTLVRNALQLFGQMDFMCCEGTVQVVTERGLLPIKEIVDNKLEVDVLSFNEETGQAEYKPITDWGTPGELSAKDWLSVKVGGSAFMRFSPEHKWRTLNGYLTTQEIKESLDDGMLQYVISDQYTTVSGFQILLASLFSDASYSTSESGSVRLAFDGFNGKQHEWVSTKVSRIKGIEFSPVIERCTTRGTTGRVSKQSSIFRWFVDQRVPTKDGMEFTPSVYDLLGPEALATWYFNDGSIEHLPSGGYRYKVVTTKCSKTHLTYMSEALSRYGIVSKVYDRSSTGQFVLRILPESRDSFNNLICPYATSDVAYKVYTDLEEYVPDTTIVPFYIPIKEVNVRTSTRHSFRPNDSLTRYDITVQDNHNYYVQASEQSLPVLVHNSQRADQVAVDTRCAEFQMACKSYQITIGVEGISQRIRNYLNKGLSTEQLYKATEYFIKSKFKEVKLYMMATELEGEEDVAEWEEYFKFIARTKHKYGSHTRFRQSFSPINVTPYTAVRWEPPRPALNLVQGIKPRSLFPVIKLGHKYKIPFRLSLKSKTVVVNQLFAFNDRRMMQPFLTWALREEGQPISNEVLDRQSEDLFALLRAKGISLTKWLSKKPKDWVFPIDHMATGYQTEYLKENAHVFTEEFTERRYCLRTQANPNPQCWNCTRCKTAEDKKKMLKHQVPSLDDPSAPTTEEIKRLYNHQNQIAKYYLIKTSVSEVHRVVSHQSVNRATVSALLQASSELPFPEEIAKSLDSTHVYDSAHATSFVDVMCRVHGTTRDICDSKKMLDWVYGIYYSVFSTRVDIPVSYFNSILQRANEYLPEGIKILGVKMHPVVHKVKFRLSKTWTLYKATMVGMDSARIRDTFSRIPNKPKIVKKVCIRKDEYKKVMVPYLNPTRPHYVSMDDKGRYIVYFMCPTVVNPYSYLDMIALKPLKRVKNILVCALGEFNPDAYALDPSPQYKCSSTGFPIEQDAFSEEPIGKYCLQAQLGGAAH